MPFGRLGFNHVTGFAVLMTCVRVSALRALAMTAASPVCSGAVCPARLLSHVVLYTGYMPLVQHLYSLFLGMSHW